MNKIYLYDAPKQWCETCRGIGTFDETLGGDSAYANRNAPCPDCDGQGYWVSTGEDAIIPAFVNDQSIDFEFPKFESGEYLAEKKKLQWLISSDFWDILESENAIIAGGAITSIFTNKPVNDIDVYFRDAESFSRVLLAVYDKVDNYSGLGGFSAARVNHYTDRSILVSSNEQDVQLIVFKYFTSAEDIFNSFDFTINMGAYDMKLKKFIFHEDFFKHNAQRYLYVNTNTDYPLISVMRTEKYRERGYTISKQQMMKLLMAVNRKQFDNWEQIKDEVGSMYGIEQDKLFDTSKPFSLEEAMLQMDKLHFPSTYNNLNSDFDSLMEKMKGKLSPEVSAWWQEEKKKSTWSRKDYTFEE